MWRRGGLPEARSRPRFYGGAGSRAAARGRAEPSIRLTDCGSRECLDEAFAQLIRRAAPLAPLLALGPVMGLLLAVAAVSFRIRRPFIGALALVGVGVFWLGAPAVLPADLRLVAAHS